MSSSRGSDRRHTTGQTTSERFGRLNHHQSASHSLNLDEDVSIVIERKVRGPPSTEPLVRRFDPDVDPVRLNRRPDEGSAPVFQRPEVLKFRHDRLSPEPKPPPRTYSSVRQTHHQHRSGSGDRERRSIHMSSSASQRRRLSRSRSRSLSRSRSPVIVMTMHRDDREQLLPPRRIHDRIGGPVRRFASLSPSTSPSPPPLGHHRGERRRRPITERLGRRPLQVPQAAAADRFYRPPPVAALEAALDPLATPKAPSYFFHDDRGDRSTGEGGGGFYRGGRGRGGRGFRRGGFRRGGGGGGIEGKWQHDKFTDAEDEPMGDAW